MARLLGGHALEDFDNLAIHGSVLDGDAQRTRTEERRESPRLVRPRNEGTRGFANSGEKLR